MFRLYLLESCIFIPRTEVTDVMENYADAISNSDLEQLAVVKKKGIKYLISYDRDFEPFEEYVTPQQFITLQGEDSSETPY